jgi:hypothetical protein
LWLGLLSKQSKFVRPDSLEQADADMGKGTQRMDATIREHIALVLYELDNLAIEDDRKLNILLSSQRPLPTDQSARQ